MTTKEQAEELIEKYKNYVHGYVGSSMLSNYEYPKQIINQAKKCALICVEEILEVINDVMVLVDIESDYDYWQEVKTEIKNYGI